MAKTSKSSSSRSSSSKSTGRAKPMVGHAGYIPKSKRPYEGGGKISK